MRHPIIVATAALACGVSWAMAQTAGTPARKPDWGVNFWAHAFYTGDAVFVDVTKVFDYDLPRDFTDELRKDPRKWSRLRLSAQGVPLDGKPELRSLLGGYPDGIYKLRHEGKGQVRFAGAASIVEGSVRRKDGMTMADVRVDRAKQKLVRMAFRDVDPKDPVRNVRLVCPGYDPDAKRIVREEFIRRTRPFSTFRFMDWGATNSSRAGKWSERRPADFLVQTPAFGPRLPMGGMAWELLIDIANECGKDIWLCVPHLADDDYVRELARLTRDRLRANSRCLIELSNELWNFSQGPELGQKMIAPDWSWQNKHGVEMYYGAVAPRLMQIAAIFRAEWGPKAKGRLEFVLAGQVGNPWHVAKSLEYFKDRKINPRDVIDTISVAPYIHPAGKHLDLDSLMAAQMKVVDEALAEARRGVPGKDARSRLYRGVKRHKELADAHGLKLNAYEGGQHVWHNRVTDGKLIGACQKDPRMRELYRKYFELWERTCPGDLFVHYTYSSGSWGLLPNTASPGSPKWDAVVSCLLPAGDCTLDGKVTYEDFQVLREHFGKDGTWWEQGDFTGDGEVGRADLSLMRKHLTGLTAEQAKTVRDLASEDK